MFDEEYRLQVIAPDGSRPFAPVDVIADSSGANVRAAPRPLADCFVITPPLEIALDPSGAPGTVRVDNGCPDALPLAAAHLRTATAAFALEGALPATLAAGESASLTLRASGPDSPDEILLFETTDAPPNRRAVTLFVSAPP